MYDLVYDIKYLFFIKINKLNIKIIDLFLIVSIVYVCY